MENEWPPLKKCIQYGCGMLQQYLQKFDWEDDEGDETDYETIYSSDDEEEIGTPRYIFRYKPSSLRKFLKQVRESRGYYVDVDIKDLPRFANTPFILVDEHFLSEYGQWVDLSIKVSIDYINAKTGKFYKHVDTLKVVYAIRHSIYLLTFTAKAVAAPRFTKRMKKKELAGKKTKKKEVAAKNKEVAAKKVEVEADGDGNADGDAETFLSTVYAPGCDAENYEVEECLLKPQGPAPWIYIDPLVCCA